LVVNVGIIGYRNHAQRLISLIETNSECKLEHIFHPNKEIDDIRGTNSFSDLLECDVIMISSPNSTHYEYLKKLKSFTGYIFCEKPPAISLEELNELKIIDDTKKGKIFFNFNYRFSELNGIFRKYLNSEEMGKIVYIEIVASQGLAFKQEYVSSWRADGTNNRFNLLDTVTIHYLDLINQYFGNSKNQFYFPKLISDNGTSYDTGHLILEYDRFNVSIINSYATPFIGELSIIGTNGYISIKNNMLEVRTPRNTFDKNNFFISPPILFSKKFDIQNDYSLSLKNSFDFFISHVLDKKKFDLLLYETSMETTQLILELKNN
jgi:predicted dehydrogenase